MARTITAAGLASLYAKNTTITWLELLTISHASISTLRLVNNVEDITSRSNTFTAFPFRMVMPEDTKDRPPHITIQICNVDQSIMTWLRSLSGDRVNFRLEIVSSEDWDEVEVGPMDFELIDSSADLGVITCTLSYEPILDHPCPQRHFTPAISPGLF